MKPTASVDDVVVLVSPLDLGLKLLALIGVAALAIARFGWLDGSLLALAIFLLTPYPPRRYAPPATKEILP